MQKKDVTDIMWVYKIPPNLPFSKGGILPLFGKEGRGEILYLSAFKFEAVN